MEKGVGEEGKKGDRNDEGGLSEPPNTSESEREKEGGATSDEEDEMRLLLQFFIKKKLKPTPFLVHQMYNLCGTIAIVGRDKDKIEQVAYKRWCMEEEKTWNLVQ